MAMNFSPNVLKKITDKSATNVASLEGSVGFILSAEWGPVNKIQSVNDETELVSKFGTPVLNKNNKDWYMISEYLRYVTGAKIVRVASDTSTTINASILTNFDNSVQLGWSTADNGAEKARRLNIDDSEPSVSFQDMIRLTVADTSAFVVDGDISGDSVAGNDGVGVVRAIDAINDYLYVKVSSGTFVSGNGIDNVSPFVGAETTMSAVGNDYDQVLLIYARYPGDKGNDIKVAICDKSTFDTGTATYDGTNTFPSVTESSLATDELLVIVTDEDDELLEVHIVSTDSTAKTTGGFSKFIDDYLYNNSSYIYSKSRSSGDKTISDFSGYFQLTSLEDGAVVQADYALLQPGYDILFNDSVNGILIVNDCIDYSDYASNHANLLAYIAGKADATQRHFCIGTLPTSAIDISSFDIADVQVFTAGLSSKYIAIYDNHKKVFDRYNKISFYIPVSGDMSGLHSLTHENFNRWEAPFGNEKGLLRNITELYHTLPQGAGSIVSQLYKEGVNSVLYKNGIGFVAWGNKTMFNAASDFSSINVSYLTIDLTERLVALLDNFISKPINLGLYTTITNTCEQLIRNEYAAGGAFNDTDGDNGYLFICDTTNNTASDVSAKRINVTLFVKPIRAAEYIVLNYIVTPAGTSFQEVS